MEQEQIELVRAATGEFFLGSHCEVISIFGGTAQSRIGETGIAFGAFPFSFVKIVPDSADQAITPARDAAEGAAKHLIGLAIPVNVSGHEGANAFFVGALDYRNKAIFVQRFS